MITFSGCPGGDPSAKQPNWITAPWPPEYMQMLDWQWKERAIPYWKETARICKQAGVRVAIEMHPNFIVYNPEAMLRLRDVAKGTIGCNFDPSHMFWQQVDVATAIRALGDCIYHVHAKDCKIDPGNTALNGVLDMKKLHRRGSSLLDLPHRRLRKRRERLARYREQPADGGVRSRHQHRTRRQPDVGRRRIEEGDRVPEGHRDHCAGGEGVLGLGPYADVKR